MAISPRAQIVGGWAAWAAVMLMACGGAASRPGGWLLGMPTAVQGAGVLALGLGLYLIADRSAMRLALGLLPVPVLLLSGLPVPGLMALSGPPLFALGLGAIAGLFAARVPRGAAPAFLSLVAVVYAGAAARVQAQIGPQGDEPHYLMVADSLLRDSDLALEADYAEGRYQTFHPEPLAPHYRVRGREGHVYSLHAVGLSVLILPAYALGGYAAVSFFMAFLGIVLAREIRELMRAWLGAGPATELAAWAVALGPPLVHYAGLVFTEIPAALAVAVVLRRGGTSARPAVAAACGLLLAFLPWLNVRYAVLSVLLLFFVLSRRPRVAEAVPWVLPAVLSAAAIALYHFSLYGFFDPRRVYGRRPELSLAHIPGGLPGLLLDQEFGLLIYAPLFALALPGLVAFLRRDRRRGTIVLAVVLAVLLTAASWPMWRGGFNPPARFLVPVVPALSVAVAVWLGRRISAGALVLAGWGLWTGLTGAAEPRLVHRDRDGTAPLFRAHSGALDWTRLLPGYVLHESRPDRLRLSLIWTAALGAAALAGQGPASAGRLAGTLGGLLLAAGMAAAVSTTRAGGRDAVRLVGQPAMAVPGWGTTPAAEGIWEPWDLDWGQLYEPHRHPAGAEIGRRLPLPAGLYLLTVEGEFLGPPPFLEVGPPGASTPMAFSQTNQQLTASFGIKGREATLALKGGGPFIVKRLRLARLNPSRTAGSNLPEGVHR